MKQKSLLFIVFMIVIFSAVGLGLLFASRQMMSPKGANTYKSEESNKAPKKDSEENKTPEEVPASKPTETNVTSKGFKIEVIDDITYIDGIMIVNKTYSLPSTYGSGLTSDTENAFYKMQSAAKKDGITIFVKSGYRSYIDQKIIYNGYVNEDGAEEADRYSARPGNSEHQSGYAVDLNKVDSDFANTPEGKWLNENAYKYGFVLRYPKDGESLTGYMYEPWHFRYVGEDLASKLYNNGLWITIEEYFGITSRYN